MKGPARVTLTYSLTFRVLHVLHGSRPVDASTLMTLWSTALHFHSGSVSFS